MLTDLAAWLIDAGLPVRTVPGWTTRGRPGTFDPAGVIIHHTASRPDSDAPALGVVTNGRTGLPGPLYQILVARSGAVWVVAAGRANHAGAGSWRGLTGNGTTIGIAGENTGTGETWPPVQYRAIVTAAAVLCRRLNIPTALVCGHKEWTPRKIDPAGIDMDRLRSDVFARVLDLEGQTQPDSPPPIPEATPMTPVEQAQAAVNAWLDPVRRIRVDGQWGPASTAALTHVLDQVAKAQIDTLRSQVDSLRATNEALHQRVTDLQASDNRATPRLVALAGIGAETARWVENVTAELAKLDQIPE